ncbi:mammalian cell entry protein [Mycobacterium sp. D16R24]|uniref:mammalian cell entry protein n=1 Tax=Mycobacterium sp. D16R24 TaxID=1855656 RepID=UPI00099385EC|nr:mammalian cell entry protein [Mycobacterium sp. D16R24]
MIEEDTTTPSSQPETVRAGGSAQTTRRRAARPAGPTSEIGAETISVSLGRTEVRSKTEPSVADSRRLGNTRAVTWAAAVLAVVLIGALGLALALMGRAQHQDDLRAARDQRFVDTAVQTVTNMMTYSQDSIDKNVDQFVNSTSGPLRGTFNPDNTANLKALYHQTGTSSEVVIKKASLESVDEISKKASILISARVTLTNADSGVNEPSKSYRMRMIVAEDQQGNMTAYDLRWPDGQS